MLSVTLLVVLAASPPPLEEAKRHLAAGRLDDVAQVLEGVTLPEQERAPAAELLGSAALKSLAAKDSVLALHLAQRALRFEKQTPSALEAAARACHQQNEFDCAEEHANRLLEHSPGAANARILRAEIAFSQGEWARVLTILEDPSLARTTKPEQKRVASMRARSQKGLSEREQGMRTLRTMERDLAKAQERAAAAADGRGTRSTVASARGTGDVIVYGTSWCGYCKKAARWLKEQGVPFSERDIETEFGARSEMKEKLTRAGMQHSGVPVIDARGTMIKGFDEAALRRILGR